MNRERNFLTAVGLLLAAAVTVALGASALSGFANASGGDYAVTPSLPIALALALGGVALIGLKSARARRKTTTAAGRQTRRWQP